MAEQVAWRAPDVTALYDTSSKKKCTKCIGGRTCTRNQVVTTLTSTETGGTTNLLDNRYDDYIAALILLSTQVTV